MALFLPNCLTEFMFSLAAYLFLVMSSVLYNQIIGAQEIFIFVCLSPIVVLASPKVIVFSEPKLGHMI